MHLNTPKDQLSGIFRLHFRNLLSINSPVLSHKSENKYFVFSQQHLTHFVLLSYQTSDLQYCYVCVTVFIEI